MQRQLPPRAAPRQIQKEPRARPGGSSRRTHRGIATAFGVPRYRSSHLLCCVLERGVDDPACPALQLRSIAATRQNLALSDVIGGSDNAFRFHSLDDSRCAIVADLEMTLNEARRRLALPTHHRHRLGIQVVGGLALLVFT